MKLESQCISLDLAIKLNKLGINNDSLAVWKRWIPREGSTYLKPEWTLSLHRGSDYEFMPAPTASELGELLPKEIDSPYKDYPFELNIKWELHYNGNKMWHITYKTFRDDEISNLDYIIYDNNLCNALAKMLIHLIESGIYKP